MYHHFIIVMVSRLQIRITCHLNVSALYRKCNGTIENDQRSVCVQVHETAWENILRHKPMKVNQMVSECLSMKLRMVKSMWFSVTKQILFSD